MAHQIISSDNPETFIKEVYSKLEKGFKISSNIETTKRENKTITSVIMYKSSDTKHKTTEEIHASWNL